MVTYQFASQGKTFSALFNFSVLQDSTQKPPTTIISWS